MAKKRETYRGLKAMSAEEPLVLIGEPGRIKGKLNLTNTGTEDMVLEGAQLRTAAATTKRSGAALEINKPLNPIIVRPGRSRSVSLKMALDPTTPPGEYDAELEAGGEVKPVKVHVIEKVDIRLFPDRLIVREAPGGTAVKRVVIRNDGNVPVTVGDIGAVVLEDDRLQCRILRRFAAAIDTGNRDAEFEDYFRTLIEQIQGVLQQAGALRVRSRSGSVTVPPGGTEAIDLEIHLPESLDKRTRYTASVALYNRNLTFEIDPILGDRVENEPR
jgi:hypothetical protein